MQFDNPSAFQAKKVQLFDRFCQSLHSFIGNLSCFFNLFSLKHSVFFVGFEYI